MFPLRNQFFPVVDENATDNYKDNRSYHFVHCAVSFLGTCLQKRIGLPVIDFSYMRNLPYGSISVLLEVKNFLVCDNAGDYSCPKGPTWQTRLI